VQPVLSEPIPDGKNALWCATFQMAWDSAAKNFGKPMRLHPASKLADALNRSSFDRRWIDDRSVLMIEGSVSDGVLEKIDKGAGERGVRSRLTGELRKISAPGDLVFYALLVKNLEFQQPFAKLGKWKVGRNHVPWFGFTPRHLDRGELMKQVAVHHYGAKNDFVIELRTKQGEDQFLLAKLPAAPATTGAASQSVLDRLRADAPTAASEDLLAVPNVVIDEKISFSELEGRRVEGSDAFVRKALQTIDFRMDEKGVKLRSEASVSFGCSAQTSITPRLMILDPPFAVVMKRKNAPQPYFVAWIANADLLGTK
jgi:hypothetical protein